MTEQTPCTARALPRSSMFLPLLSVVFFLSGFSALLYQVAWQRLLTLYYGVGAISITVIVSVYMLGLGVGALIGAAAAERVSQRIRLYAFVELAIAFFGVLSLPFLAQLGVRTAGSSYPVTLLCVSAFLLVPTLLMGTTLPLLTKIFNRAIGDFFSTVSTLYFLNTAGAAAGALLGAYLIISFLGLDRAVYCATAINFALALLIVLAGSLTGSVEAEASREQGSQEQGSQEQGEPGRLGVFAYPLVLVTGFLAIGYEIVWLRVTEVLTKNSPYSFATVLAVYLLGIALGSLAISRCWGRLRSVDKRSLFFLLQFLIGLYVLAVFSAYVFATRHTWLGEFTRLSFATHPHPYLNADFATPKDLLKSVYTTLDIFLWPLAFLFVPTLLMGATFPLVSLLAFERAEREAGTVGTIYWFNILGNVLGGIVTGFVLLRLLGTEPTLLVFSLTGLSFGMFVSSLGPWRVSILQRAALLGALAASALLAFPGRHELYAVMHPTAEDGYRAHFAEGVDAVVATFEQGESIRNYINGLLHGMRPSPASFYEIAEAARAARRFEEVLLIGYGTGTFAEAVLKVPELRRATLVELSETSIRNLRKIPVLDRMLSHPKLELVIDDGRRFLHRTDRTFDAILVDPLHPQTAYSNNIYSREFFELVRDHLSVGGVFVVYTGANRIVANTVLAVFPEVRAYDRFCLASQHRFGDDQRRMETVLAGFSTEERQQVERRAASFRGEGSSLRQALSGGPINEDARPVAEYYLRLGLEGTPLLDDP